MKNTIVENAFWMNYAEGANAPTAKFFTRADAQAEAERICDRTGKEIFTLQCICSVKPIQQEKYIITKFSSSKATLPF